jgi:hypothetical protein
MSRYGQIVGDRGCFPEFVSIEYRKSSELTKTEARCHLCNRRSIAPRQKDASDFHQSELSQIAGWSGVMHHLEGPRNGTRVSSGEAAKIIDTHDVAEVGACNSHEIFDDLRIPIHRPSDGLAFFTPANTKLLQIDPAVATTASTASSCPRQKCQLALIQINDNHHLALAHSVFRPRGARSLREQKRV